MAVNMDLAGRWLQSLINYGVKEFCLCPGARNASFVATLEANPQITTHLFYHEGSASFFALGRARRDQRPVAVITTSGTAVSETLSAVIEAWHSQVPLVILSADRPLEMRYTGAPQTIMQTQIFNNFVEKSLDITKADQLDDGSWSAQRPLHLNICFDEPLLDGKPRSLVPLGQGPREKTLSPNVSMPYWDLSEAFVVVGALSLAQRPDVCTFLKSLNTPFYVEALSGLRARSELMTSPWHLHNDQVVSQLLNSGQVKQVLRLGDIPVGRYWRDLENLDSIETFSLSDKNFPGLSRGHLYCQAPNEENLSRIQIQDWPNSPLHSLNTSAVQRLQDLIDKYPDSEVARVHKLCKEIPKQDRIFLGNSLPVRHWDLVGRHHEDLWASRGVNGIDGQLSTALGLAQSGQPLWVILGDLTTLYDFSGFWVGPQLSDTQVNLCVINNGGGQIFRRLFTQDYFINSHQLDFSPLAQMWGWSYQKPELEESLKLSSDYNLIEICPDDQQSQSLWREWSQPL